MVWVTNFVTDGMGDSKRDKDADPEEAVSPHTSDAHMELRGISREGTYILRILEFVRLFSLNTLLSGGMGWGEHFK